MTQGRPLNAALSLGCLALAALALSGCVAAAIPVVAGAAVARSATDGVDANLDSAAERSARIEPLPGAGLPGAAAGETGDETPVGTPATSPKPITESRSLARFFSYARQWEGARSAVLSQPAALDGNRRECENTAPGVLIDLDPAGSVFAPPMAITAPPQMVTGLAELRARGVAIAWISEASAANAGDVRAALKSSGLDPESRDALLMTRYPTDRKQTRRDDFAAATCLIAIAGDERADFDELFRHLVNHEAAYSLERIIGDGWFLVPGLMKSSTITSPQDPNLAAMEEMQE